MPPLRTYPASRLAALYIVICMYVAGSTGTLHAQGNAAFVTNIRTLQVKKNGQWGEMPILQMGSNNFLEISFDDMQHDYVRYTYRILHCDAHWKESDIYPGDYMTGTNESVVIDDYQPSMNTEVAYNHYRFTLPNKEHKLLISGNYKVEILESGYDEPVAQACFCVLESGVGIDVSVSANTDIDAYQEHQQVDFTINHQQLSTNNAETELIPIVTQNRRWDNHVEGIKPSYLRTNQLVYTHNRDLIFKAGNEYRRFEILDEYVATMGVERMRYESSCYNAYLYPGEQRRNYKYDEDQDGRFQIRNSNDANIDTESDYFYTHFTLQMPEIPGGRLYIDGDLTDNLLNDDFLMTYNPMDHQYEITLLLKQGAYNYQYLFIPDGGDTGLTKPAEGDFHQTENEYSIYVYQRPFGGRYDKLVGFKQIKFNE